MAFACYIFNLNVFINDAVDKMTEKIPESPIWINRYWDRFENWYCSPRKDYCFVVEWDEVGNPSSGWCEISQNQTINFRGNTYDTELAKYWYGRKTLFVLKGTRLPPDFSKYQDNFVNISVLEGKNTPLSKNSKVANVKMNTKYAYELAMGLKHGDFVIYAAAAAALMGLISVALLMDYLHMPMYETMKQNFVQVLNNTQPGWK